MKVILIQDVVNIGHAGDVKNVADGYARNYLIPRGLALQATPGAMKEFRAQRESDARHEAHMAARAEALAERLRHVTLTFEAKVGEKGRLYGSITPADIAEALERETGQQFDRRKHIISEPIREVGAHTVQIRLRADVTAEIQVLVKPAGEEPAEGSEAGTG